ncbi:IS4 family transposase [Leptolyngbya sp. O-77]|uniref:IS4 family transposase n=1 Tax=Leptolyngbya sp. O-77 TaxID=1080068 RepID=UPI00074D46EC|nr:IS4 family transposase [Leptolyngbya sp. O-77]BAU44629.1 Transposase DDE domain protein [Leptolyngbya sp. O-77]
MALLGSRSESKQYEERLQALNIRGIKVKISTFSKASKNRDPQILYDLFWVLKQELHKRHKIDAAKLTLFPLDSTIVSLTSKLLWAQGIHQVKLFSGLDLMTHEPGGVFIHFGQGHDSKHGKETIDAVPDNSVGVMDRGFFSLARIRYLLNQENRYFIVRIKNNISLKMLENGNFLIGTGKEQVEARVVAFCDLESQTEYRLSTNLPIGGENTISNEEISEFYRLRWQIELFWKFLKMHLKLDRLITKNVNGIEMQIYACLVAYVILQLVTIPKEFGNKVLDKLRYLQAFMCENISYAHWLQKLVFC